MNKSILKIIGLLLGLILIVAALLFVAINGIEFGKLNLVSITGIGEKKQSVDKAEEELALAELQYGTSVKTLETAKQNYDEEKEKYELISDETISAIKEATKEEEYFIEYLWITLGNYATKHNLALAVIEPGGKVSQSAETKPADDTTVSTGTGVTGNQSGVTSTTNAATTGSPTSGTQKNPDDKEDVANKEESVTSGLSSSATALTVQIKGSYIDLADFVFEVENDKSLRFRLDNIKMKSAGGTQVIASFNVKDFRVLKSLER